MEITGTIKAMTKLAEGVSSKTGNPWKKQGFVIENNGGGIATGLYFEVFNDRIDQMTAAGMKVDAVGKLYFDVHAHNYNGRWFNDVRGWKWEPGQSWEQQAAGPSEQTEQEGGRVDAFDHLKQQAAQTRSHTGGSSFYNKEPNLPF